MMRPMMVTLLTMAMLSATCGAQSTPAIETLADFDQWRKEHARQTMTRDYLAHGYRHRQFDDDVQQLLLLWNDVLFPQFTIDGAKHVAATAQDLVDSGCADPLVIYLLGWGLDQSEKDKDAEPWLRAAIDGFQDSFYPPGYTAMAASRLARLLEALKRTDEAVAFHRIAAESYVQKTAARGADPPDARLLWIEFENHMARRFPIEVATYFQQLIKDAVHVDPWLREMALGVYEKRMAWEARGNGFAHTVTDEGWQVFHRRIAQAAEHLQHAHAMHPDRPEAARELVPVAMAGGTGNTRNEQYWFEQVVNAQFDWTYAHESMIWALRPRWGGSYDRMYEFGVQCAQTERYDTLVPYQLIRAVLDIGTDSDDGREYWTRPGLYENVRDVLQRYAEQPYGSRTSEFYKSLHLGIAWNVDQWDDAAALLNELGPDVDVAALSDAGAVLHDVEQSLAVARVGLEQFVTDVRAMYADGEFDLARTKVSNALAAEEDPAAVAVLRDVLRTVELGQSLTSGEWTPLRFERELPGWTVRAGAVQVLSDTSFRAGADDDGLRFICDTPVGSRWALRGQVDVRGLQYTDRSSNVGFLVNFVERLDINDDWQAVALYHRSERVNVSHRYWKGYIIRRDLPMERFPDQFQFELNVWDGTASLHMDGEQVFSGAMPRSRSFRPGPFFGFGAFHAGYWGFVIYDNLELRLLSERPSSITPESVEQAWRGEWTE